MSSTAVNTPHRRAGRSLFAGLAAIVLACTALTAAVSHYNGKREVDAAIGLLAAEVGRRIDHDLSRLVGIPPAIVQFNAGIVTDFKDMRGMQQMFWQELALQPSLSAIFAATEAREFAGVERTPEMVLTKTFSAAQTRFAFTTHRADANGNELTRLRVQPDYDPRQRPWYLAAQAHAEPVWTDIYPFPLHHALYIARVAKITAVRGPDGVVAAAMSLGHIGQLLHGLKVGQQGRAFIVERNGLLVASGADEPLFHEEEQHTTRVHGTESTDSVVRAASKALQDRIADLNTVQGPQQWFTTVDGNTHLLRVQAFSDGKGLDWIVVIALPRDELLAGTASPWLDWLGVAAVLAMALALIRQMVSKLPDGSTSGN